MLEFRSLPDLLFLAWGSPLVLRHDVLHHFLVRWVEHEWTVAERWASHLTHVVLQLPCFGVRECADSKFTTSNTHTTPWTLNYKIYSTQLEIDLA